MSEAPDQHVRRGRGRGRGRGTSRGSPSPCGQMSGSSAQTELGVGLSTQESSISTKERRTSHGRDRKKPEVQIYVPRARRQQNAQDHGDQKTNEEDSHMGSAKDSVGSPGEQRTTKSGRRARPEMQRYVPRGRRQHVSDRASDMSPVPDRASDMSPVPDRASDMSRVSDRASDMSSVPDRAIGMSGVSDRASGMSHVQDRASERSPVPDSWDDAVEEAPHRPPGVFTDSPKASSVKKFKSESEYEDNVSRLGGKETCIEQRTNVIEERFEDSSCFQNNSESLDTVSSSGASNDSSDRKSGQAFSEILPPDVHNNTAFSDSQLPNNSDSHLSDNPETESLLRQEKDLAQKSDSLQKDHTQTISSVSMEDESQRFDSEQSEVNTCPKQENSVQSQYSLNSTNNNHSSVHLAEDSCSILTQGESSQKVSSQLPASPVTTSREDQVEDQPMSVDSATEKSIGPSQEPSNVKEEEHVSQILPGVETDVPIDSCEQPTVQSSQGPELCSSLPENSIKQTDQVKDCNLKSSLPNGQESGEHISDKKIEEDSYQTNGPLEKKSDIDTDDMDEQKVQTAEVKSNVQSSTDSVDEEDKTETTESVVDQKMAEEAEALELEKMLKAQAIAALDFAPPATSASASASQDEEEEEDSWDKIFDDNGDCLDPSLIEELTAHVGKVQIDKPKIDYLNFQPKEQDMDMEMYNHIIEIYDFPSEFLTRDLITAFRDFMSRGFDIKWVDDTHALGVFASSIAAQDALTLNNPLFKVRRLSEASRQSKTKAKKNQEFLQPFKARPQTSASAARRLVSGALGLQAQIPREKRDLERKQLKEAKEKRRKERKLKQDMWDGSVGRCAMDQDG